MKFDASSFSFSFLGTASGSKMSAPARRRITEFVILDTLHHYLMFQLGKKPTSAKTTEAADEYMIPCLEILSTLVEEGKCNIATIGSFKTAARKTILKTPPPPNPEECLDGRRFDTILRYCRENLDHPTTSASDREAIKQVIGAEEELRRVVANVIPMMMDPVSEAIRSIVDCDKTIDKEFLTIYGIDLSTSVKK